MPKLAIRPLTRGLLSIGKPGLHHAFEAKSAKKNNFFCFAILNHFQNVQILPILFPKDSTSLKILYIRLKEVGAKICLNSTSKVNTRTHTQTNRLIESIGPEGRCFEKPERKKKSRIQKTKNLCNVADSSTNRGEGGDFKGTKNIKITTKKIIKKH